MPFFVRKREGVTRRLQQQLADLFEASRPVGDREPLGLFFPFWVIAQRLGAVPQGVYPRVLGAQHIRGEGVPDEQGLPLLKAGDAGKA